MKNVTKFKGAFNSSNPEMIVLHHALKKKCTIQDVHDWHLKKGWKGCAYQYFISKTGEIFRGRPDTAEGGHLRGRKLNSSSIGICLEGFYQNYKDQTDKQVPEEQMEALIKLVKHLMCKYDIHISCIYKHNHFAKYKKCPGNYFPWNEFCSELITDYREKYFDLKNKLMLLAEGEGIKK
jgi:N-acetylmuramoyl-L-alanine amidase